MIALSAFEWRLARQTCLQFQLQQFLSSPFLLWGKEFGVCKIALESEEIASASTACTDATWQGSTVQFHVGSGRDIDHIVNYKITLNSERERENAAKLTAGMYVSQILIPSHAFLRSQAILSINCLSLHCICMPRCPSSKQATSLISSFPWINHPSLFLPSFLFFSFSAATCHVQMYCYAIYICSLLQQHNTQAAHCYVALRFRTHLRG